jgi:cytochrome c peroxidase
MIGLPAEKIISARRRGPSANERSSCRWLAAAWREVAQRWEGNRPARKFTDFTASNIGTPANPLLPYYAEQQPDARGYAANPTGSGYVDPGVGGFLTEQNLLSPPSAVDARWRPLRAQNMGRSQVPTLRNVDKRPNPS